MNRITRKTKRPSDSAAHADRTASVVHEVDKPKSRSLFHYTNAAGLIGIIQSQSLFATHANFLNDSAECKILVDLLRPRITEETKRLSDQLIQLGLLKKDILLEGESIFSKQADVVLNSILRATENISPIYICSLCLHDPEQPAYKNGLLSQWRGYGSGGFAIEFDELQIDQLTLLENSSFRYQGLLTNVVHYDDHEQAAKLDRFDGLAKATHRNLFERDKVMNEIFGDKQIDHFMLPLLSTLPFLKDAGFREENEYRIAALCNRPGVGKLEDPRAPKDVHFRSSVSGAVVPYIKLFAGLTEKLPIKAILVGPHRNQDNQQTALRLLLDQHQIDAEIRRSELTFRDL